MSVADRSHHLPSVLSYKQKHFSESKERSFSTKLFLFDLQSPSCFQQKIRFFRWHYPLFISNYNSSYSGSRERLTLITLYCLKDAMGTAARAHCNTFRTSSNLLEMLSSYISEKGRSAELVTHSYTAASWRGEGRREKGCCIHATFTSATAAGSLPTEHRVCSAPDETCVANR